MSETTTNAGDYRRVYDRLYRFGYHSKKTKSHAKILSERTLQRWNPESILDVGCSLGWTLEYFTEQGVRAVGVDISSVAVKKAQKLGRDAKVACASSLPFEDNAFDIVLSTDCLEHLREDDAKRAVDEMCRVAKRGIAIKVNPRLDRDRLWKFIAGTPLHLTLRQVEEWLGWFEAQGWTVADSDQEREEFLLEPRAE